jgi:multidrug efflux pump subunit AcrA (membrane-fusion protein)
MEISPRVSAHIVSIPVRAGQQVKKADLLVRCDERDLETRLMQAREALRRSEAERELATSDHLRDAGFRSGQIRSAAAQHDIARAAEEKLRLEIEHEVRTAVAELDSARARVRAMLESLSQAEEALRDERLKYESGRSAINFVLDAEAAMLTSRSQLRAAQRSIAIASLLLDLSLGRIQPA